MYETGGYELFEGYPKKNLGCCVLSINYKPQKEKSVKLCLDYQADHETGNVRIIMK